MAQSGFTPILIYASGTTTNVPLAANLTSSANGAELALNYADGKLFYKDSGGVVQVLASKGAGTVGGSNTQVQYNSSGSLAGSANHTFDGTTLTLGNAGVSSRFQGDFSNATFASRTAFQTGTTNGTTGIYALPNGTSTAASWQATNNSDPTNASKILIATNGSTDVQLVSGINGTGTYLPLSFYTNGSQQMRLDTSGNLGLGVTPYDSNVVLAAYRSQNNLLFMDLQNPNTGTSAGSIFRLITQNVANTGTTSVDIVKYKTGGFNINNNETNSAAYTAFVVGASERMRIDSSGRLLVGQTSNTDSATVQINQQSGGGNIGIETISSISTTAYHLMFRNTNGQVGSIQTSGSATSYVTSSDYRLKENIASMVGALDKVAQLKPVTYTWKADGSDGQGFIAHELAEVVPDCVTGEKDAVDAEGKPVYQGIDTSFLVATLTAAIQELSAKVTALEAQLGAK